MSAVRKITVTNIAQGAESRTAAWAFAYWWGWWGWWWWRWWCWFWWTWTTPGSSGILRYYNLSFLRWKDIIFDGEQIVEVTRLTFLLWSDFEGSSLISC